MKRRILYVLSCVVSVSLLFVVVGASASGAEGRPVESIGDSAVPDPNVLAYLTQYPLDENFGGFYFDKDVLVVNYVSDCNAIIKNRIIAGSEMNMEYRPVKYSLQTLESVKDCLAPMMEQYEIIELDANEMTNQVDVSLKNFSEERQECIADLVKNQFGTCDFLNFIDASTFIIQATVAYE